MRLDSVRGLKNEIASYLGQGPLAAADEAGSYEWRPAGVRAFDIHAHRWRALERNQPLVALGVQPADGAGRAYRLAVRIQRRGFQDSPALQEIVRRARGEADVRYIGVVVKRDAPWYRQRKRPLLIGSSIGHLEVTAGTLGCFVRRRARPAQVEVLSNNHVLADENEAQTGDAVVQPGPYDGGTPRRDRVATLARFVKLTPRRPNTVDCAVASIDDGVEYDPNLLTGVGTLGPVATATELAGGGEVAKLGRTTGHTRGRVTAFELDGVTVRYDVGLLRFDDQLEVEGADDRAFSDGGDSGSLIFTAGEHRAAALLFAGSDQGGRNGRGLTYANPIASVLEQLKVELVS